MSDPTLCLPFDQYQRYRLVTDILQAVRGNSGRLAILDVGGRTALLRKFLPDDDVFIVDVDPSTEEGLVLGDGSRLPFQDACVDAVVTFDTLEHVPPAGRAAFLAECRRVARRWVVVAGPYDTPGVADAERLLTEFLRDKLKVEHRYLAEHAAHGLPRLAETERALATDGAQVTSIGHANLHRWMALMCTELYLDHDAPLRPLAAKYYEYYNGSHYASDHAAPVYRHAVVAAMDGIAIPTAQDLFGPPVAPAGTYEPVAHVLKELLAFDIQRDVVKAEWDRLETVNAGLFKDLQGHRETLETLEAENASQRGVLGEQTLRIEQLEAGQKLLEERGSVLEDTIAHERRCVQDLELRITGLLEELAARASSLAQQAEQIGALQGNMASLEQNIASLEARLHEANTTLGTKQNALDTVREKLTQERQASDQLRSQLRDRWANLLRAIGVKN